MYSQVTFTENIKVPPQLLGEDVEESINESLKNQFEGQIDPDLGVVLAVKAVDDIGEGEIRPEEAGVYYPVTADVITFMPEMHEVVVGEVSDITEFGAFIDLGPMEGLCHVSQIMDDYVSYNEEQHVLAGEDGSRTLQEGDVVKARVTAVSLDENDQKVNLTMRQPGLGKLDWIAEEAEELEQEADAEDA
jgi:DNA-directed RNA polymerase subunit E'